jgi:hypothetical protein
MVNPIIKFCLMGARFFSFILIVFLISVNSFSQDLENMLENEMKPTTDFTTATFKSTRVLNGHSIERMPAGQLDFRISHRFGLLNSGAYNLWGLDQANIHFSLEYGITNWLMVGVGRGTYEKAYDGFLKLSILRQSKGAVMMPVSLSFFSSIYDNTLKWDNTQQKNYYSSRLSFVHQILIARKFNDYLSFQISPTYLHKNLVPTIMDSNDIYSIGIGGRVKISKRVTINAEYYYIVHPARYAPSVQTYNPLSLGFDIETGGHVFQIIFTNSLAMVEKGIIGETTGQWLKGDIHLGFNISRVFTLDKPKNKKT